MTDTVCSAARGKADTREQERDGGQVRTHAALPVGPKRCVGRRYCHGTKARAILALARQYPIVDGRLRRGLEFEVIFERSARQIGLDARQPNAGGMESRESDGQIVE